MYVGAIIDRLAVQRIPFRRSGGRIRNRPPARAGNARPYIKNLTAQLNDNLSSNSKISRQLILYLNFRVIFCLLFPKTVDCHV